MKRLTKIAVILGVLVCSEVNGGEGCDFGWKPGEGVPGLDGSVYALNPSSGELVTVFPIGSQLASAAAVFDNYVIFASHAGGIYKINSVTQEIVQIAAFESSIDGPLTIYEGIIYLQTHDAALQRIDVQTGALLPPIPLVSQ